MDNKDHATVDRLQGSDLTSCQEISKPAIDLRDYRAIRLPNGARFVLVQDKEAVFAAAAVNVQAGYMDDPAAVPGLAHFLEHAVHLGSAAFPEEAAYKTYLAKHGGNSNASTGMVHTVFHLTIHNEGLEGALARLAPFFISPLLDPESAMREVENVHAEFSRNCNSDERKLLQLRRSLSGGRYSQFSTGNITTLRDIPAEKGIHTAELLRSFWDAHYTAGRITGCIVAPQPLETQEQWVRQYFSEIRSTSARERPTSDLGVTQSDHTSVTSSNTNRSNGNVNSNSSGNGLSATQLCSQQIADTQGRYQCDFEGLARGLGSLVFVSPQRQALRSLELLWLVPQSALSSTWKWSKPWRFLSHLLGHEGPGSLTAVLRQAGLCTDLSVGVGDEVRLEPGFMFWSVTVQLTEQGLNHVTQVVVAVYHALAMIKGLPEAQRQQLWEEAAEVAKLRWEYADKAEPRDVARDLSNRAHYWETHHLLDGPALLQHYHGADIDDFLTHITPDKMMVVVCAKDAAGPQPDTEQWYGAKYKQEKLPQELISACQAAVQTSSHPPSNTEAIRIPSISLTAMAASTDNNNGSTKLVQPGDVHHSNENATTNSDMHGSAAAGTNPASSFVSQSFASDLLLPYITPPGKNWALPVDVTLKTTANRCSNPQGAREQSQGKKQADVSPDGNPKQMEVSTIEDVKRESSGNKVNLRVVTPRIVMHQQGLKLWHATDTTWNLPKAYIYFNIFTPLVYQSPTSWVTARLLVRLLDDLLQPEVYSAELLGTSYSMSCTETGFTLTLRGFSSVLPRLLRLILEGLRRLATDIQHVASRHHILAGKLAQQLTVWKHSNPLQHAEYAADHLLQVPHWHVDDSLAALLVDPAAMPGNAEAGNAAVTPSGSNTSGSYQQVPENNVQSRNQQGSNDRTYRSEVGPEAVCLLARQLSNNMTVEGLCYGNMDQQDAEMVGNMVLDLLKAQGLSSQLPGVQELSTNGATAAIVGDQHQDSTAKAIGETHNGTSCRTWPGFEVVKLEQATFRASDRSSAAKGVTVRYVVPNPNPSNTNSAVLYICQACDDRAGSEDEIKKGVLLDLLVQMASKRCFHALRTTQRLGYIVSLSTHRLHGVASLQIRVQTPDKTPDVVRQSMVEWLLAYQQELAETEKEQFDDFKASLSSKLSEPARSLSDAASRAWRPISNCTYAFQRRQEKLALLEQIDLNELLNFYNKHILPVVDTAMASRDTMDTVMQPVEAVPEGLQGSVEQPVAVEQGNPQERPHGSDNTSSDAGGTVTATISSSNSNRKNVQSNALICEVWGSKAVKEISKPAAELNSPPDGVGELFVATNKHIANLQSSLQMYPQRLPMCDSM